MQSYKLYGYQKQASDIGEAALLARRSEIVCMPTGAGKSVVISEIIRRWKPSERKRILVVTHVKELVEQNAAAIQRHMPELKIGIVCSGLSKREWGTSIVIGTIQSLYNHPWATNFSAIIVDECHLIRREDQSMYQTLIRRIREIKPNVPVIGLSATPYRLDTGYLHEGDGRLFDRIGFDIAVPTLLKMGVLAPLVGCPVTPIKTTGLVVRDNDYNVGQYTEVVQSWMEDTSNALDTVIATVAGRKKIIIFSCSVVHAQAISWYLSAHDIASCAVYNGMSRRERDGAILKFKTGSIKALVNVNILTTGFDAPGIDAIVMLRPTMSTGLYVQMLGRGMRISEHKDNCVVFDFVGNVDRHGTLTDIIPAITELKLSSHGGLNRACSHCGEKLHPMALQCVHCNHIFARISSTPSSGPFIAHGTRHATQTQTIYLSTEDVAKIIQVGPTYVKQMRSAKYGPPYLRTGGMTRNGWREIVYDMDAVKEWMKKHPDRTRPDSKQVKRSRKGSEFSLETER